MRSRNITGHSEEVDPVTGEAVRAIVAAHLFRWLEPEERVRRRDEVMGGECGKDRSGDVCGARLVRRRVRSAGGVYRFLDAGEVVRAADQWRDGGGGWRPVWSAVDSFVVNEEHLRRRVDDLVEYLSDLRPAVGNDPRRLAEEIAMELGV